MKGCFVRWLWQSFNRLIHILAPPSHQQVIEAFYFTRPYSRLQVIVPDNTASKKRAGWFYYNNGRTAIGPSKSPLSFLAPFTLTGIVRTLKHMLKDLDLYYEQQPEPVRSCVLALREIILSFSEHFTHEWKYRMPLFCYKGKMCCYLWTDKKSGAPYMGFVEGKHLHHPLLEQGKRAKMKILPIDPEADLPVTLIQDLLKQSIHLYETGIVKLPRPH